MRKEWFSAAELVGLAGLPGTIRGVTKKAKREDWQRRGRQARGGGYEYHFDTLPAKAQQAIRDRRAVEAVNDMTAREEAEDEARRLAELRQAADELGDEAEREEAERRRVKEDGLRRFIRLPSNHPKRRRAKAREWLLIAFYNHHREHGGDERAARHSFCERVNTGALKMPARVVEQLPRYHGQRSLSESTLRRWNYDFLAGGLWALTDGYGHRRGDNKVERSPELKCVVIGSLLKVPHITGRKLKAYIQARYPELDLMSERGLQRYIQAFKRDNAQLWTYLTHPDKWKNIYLAAHGSQSEPVVRLNQLWELDSTPADWMLADGRHSVIGVVDLYSRRLRYRVAKTSTAAGVCALMRAAMLDWGVPEAVRTDNGQDYISEQLEEVLHGLDIGHELCIPFASEQKATIERAMRTMSHGILDLLPGFIGHSVAERKVIEARKSFARRVMDKDAVIEVSLTAAELQEKLDAWCTHVYAHDAHSGEGMDGRTPFERATAWTGAVRRIEDERALDALLAPLAGTRSVGKKGVRLDRHWYIAPELTEHVGEVVRLKRDEADLGRLYVYDADGAFICIAQAPEITGISRAEAAAAAKHHQREFIRRQSAELTEYKKAVKENIADTVLQYRIKQSEQVTALPHKADPYTTAGLEAAGQAARAGDAP
ncbi:MAG: transposase, partial [Nitrococcus mobilis]|nr:transposase [Nitrococcus mobilis]